MEPYREWLEEQREGTTAAEFALLERAVNTLIGDIAEPEPGTSSPLPWHPLRGIRPSSAHYAGIWNWDAAFHALSVSRWDPQLAREQVEIFIDTQLDSGALVDVIFTNGRVVTTHGKPPVFPWAVVEIDRRDPDQEFAERAYSCFCAYEAFWRRERGGGSDGLFHYNSTGVGDEHEVFAKYESGWDTSVRFDETCSELWAIDLNCYMIMLYRAMQALAKRVDKDEDCRLWSEREAALTEAVNTQLFDTSANCYVDRNRLTGTFSDVLSPASFMPLYIDIASDEQAAATAALAADPAKMYPGMPTVAYDHPEYRSNNYWRGPTWLNTAYFALKGLKQYGFVDVADTGRSTILDWCTQNPDGIYEYYDSQTGKGIGAIHFGWSAAFIIEFILNW